MVDKIGLRIVLAVGVALCGAFLACSSKASEKKDPAKTSAKASENAAHETSVLKTRARISPRVDDSKGERDVARPETSDAMEIRSFVAPMDEGKAVLVLELSGKTMRIPPSQLSQIKTVTIDGPGTRTGWSLLDAITALISIEKIARIEAHAGGEVKRLSGDALKKGTMQLLIRHNKRGELRLKVFDNGKETDDGVRALERVVIVPR